MKSALETNREYSDSYVQKIDSNNIPKIVKELLISNDSIKKIIDLGCGYGGFINSLNVFDYSKKIVGVDISSRRIEKLKNMFPKDRFLCEDICNTNIKEKFDFIHSAQVIEHVEDDKKMILEMNRLLRKGGFLYVSSVIKKPWAVYKYKNRFGKFTLDLTHEMEYQDKEEFLRLFPENFRLIKLNIFPVKRIFMGIGIVIPGYFIVEGLWKKEK